MEPTFYDTVVLQDACGNTWEGDVVSHLPLADWALMKGYTVVSCEGSLPALPFQLTRLSPRRTISGYYVPPTAELLRKVSKK